MKDNRLRGIIALAVVTVLSFGVVYGSKALTKDTSNNGTTNQSGDQTEGGLDVSGFDGITAAREITDGSGAVTGYAVTTAAKGFAGNVTLEVNFDADGKTINGLSVVSHSETPGYGANMENEDYLSQFNGITAPVYLPGNAPAVEATETEEEPAKETTTEETTPLELKDGTYTAETELGNNGYKDVVTVTIQDGAITEVVWDALNEAGEKKSVLSANGQYVMTEDGPTWAEQAEAIAAFVVENQTTNAISMDENGKTDSVAGVSISVDGFVKLVEECLAQASGTVTLKDGIYKVEADSVDNKGYLYMLTLKVENGAITSVVWDSMNELGEYKSYLSSVGKYVMTEDGPTWKEQADALAANVIENQSIAGITVDENGKTDSVAGVSISVDNFVDLVEKALKLAASGEGSVETETEETEDTTTSSAGTEIDAISGATVTSNAIVEAINNAYEFVRSYTAK